MSARQNAAAFLVAALGALALGGVAEAATCGGEAPADAAEIHGPVLAVLDGQRLCVALGADPASWATVRIADAVTRVSTAPPSRGALMAASFGQDVTCRIVGREAGAVVAECRTDRGSVGALAGDAATVEAGRAWR
ncbi:MAG: hypothetical protein GC203_08105 [Phenylobacterium sp.]|uniref:hypothetical protein n=1 Tax=Phenylobacterium sp. TaxID=1871053 RepID=UPI0025DE0319|nr:hypothetical protein [Phenylobacterium sp.]MBI1197811.1 hypothetical protein [Phenylobacterium sp.]